MANPFAVTALRMELKCNYNGAALQHEVFVCSTVNTTDEATPLQKVVNSNKRKLTPARFMYAIGSALTLADIQAAAPQIDHLILQAGRWDWGDAAKVVNPKIKVYMYKDAAGITNISGLDRLGGTTYIAGVGKPQADAGGASWYLHATSLGGIGSHPSSIMQFSDFPGNWLANIATPAYYNAWATNVITEMQQGMWDGVFFDDMNPAVENHWTPGPGDVAEYPSDATYAAAFDTFMLHTTTRIRNAGYIAVANFGPFWGSGYVDRMDLMNRWASDYLDISMDEFWIKWRDTTVHAPAQILEQIANLRHVMSRDKMFLAVLPGQVGAAWAPQFRLAMSCALLVAKGYDRFLSHYDNTDMGYNDAMITHPEQTPNLGAPLGRYTQVVSGQFVRLFEKGEVHVNISGSSKTINFQAPVYGSGLSGATSASLATLGGAIVTYNPDPMVNSDTGIGAASIGNMTIGVRDTVSTVIQIGASDSQALTDVFTALSQGFAASDTQAQSDATASTIARASGVTDSLTFSDAVAAALARASDVADSATQSDASAVAPTTNISGADATAFSETLASILEQTAKAGTDTGTLLDALTTLSAGVGATDAHVISDLAALMDTTAKALTDSATQGDASALADTTSKAVIDGLTLREALALAVSLAAADSATQGDASTAGTQDALSANDSAVQSDAPANMQTGDGFNLSDSPDAVGLLGPDRHHGQGRHGLGHAGRWHARAGGRPGGPGGAHADGRLRAGSDPCAAGHGRPHGH